MDTRRPWLHSRRSAGFTPLDAALLSLASLSIAALLAVLWPDESPPPAHGPRAAKAVPAVGPFEGALRRPPESPAPRRAGTWI